MLEEKQPAAEPEPGLEPVAPAAIAAKEVSLAAEPEAVEPFEEEPLEVAPAALAPEPLLAELTRIRFEEEISEAPRGKSKRAKGRKDGAVESDEAAAAKPKRAKRSRPVYDIEEEDDLGAYNDLVRLQRR